MLRFKLFLEESLQEPSLEWTRGDPSTKHWSDRPFIFAYHGTHIRNVPNIQKQGLNTPDPSTGMVSVAVGNHGGSVARGYASMSGEHNFRKAGAKAVSVPSNQRGVVVFKIPTEWVKANHDPNFGGNPPAVKQRLQSKEEFEKHVEKHGEPFAATETPELRFSSPIPHEFVHGWMRKDK